MKKIWVSSYLFLAAFSFFMSSLAFHSGSGLSSVGNPHQNRRNCEPANGIKLLSDINGLPTTDQLATAEKHHLQLTYTCFENSPPPPGIRNDPLSGDTPDEVKELIHSSLEFAMFDSGIAPSRIAVHRNNSIQINY